MVRKLKNILLIAVVFVSGIAAKSVFENDKAMAYIADRYLTLLLIVLFVLVGASILFWLMLSLIPWYLKQKYKLNDSHMTDQEMVSRLTDRVLFGEHAAADLSHRQQQGVALSRLGLWFLRREAIGLYLSIIISVGGGIIGTATVYLLQKQNEKLDEQNVKLTLQTDATIVQSLLIEGTRRAALGEELTRLLSDISTEVESAKVKLSNLDELDAFEGIAPFCKPDEISACWVNLNDRQFYRLSTELFSRVSSYLDQATPYHYSAGAVSDPNFDRQLREQIDLDYGSPERASIARRLNDLQVSADELNFSGALLNQGRLVGGSFSQSNFEGADLTNAKFASAILGGTLFIQANLERTDFRYADLSGANFDSANLKDAVFDGANLSTANLTNADLTNTYFLPLDVKGDGLVRVNLRSANFTSARLVAAQLSGADLQGSKFVNADLSSAELKNANLISATLSQSNLHKADFTGADMSGANLNSAQVSGAIFDGTTLIGTNFTRVWAWTDLAPNLPTEYKISLCQFYEGQNDRSTRPENCN